MNRTEGTGNWRCVYLSVSEMAAQVAPLYNSDVPPEQVGSGYARHE